jgi:hypothetical protein
MKRERYKGQIVVARLLKVRALPIWHASVSLDRLVNGTWLEIPIEPGLAGLEFASEDIALSAALSHARGYVDSLNHSQRFIGPSSKAPGIGFAAG